MMRFAFYGRVSTEDQQDPTASRGWQLTRARQLIEPHGGVVVAEFFDIGQSRSLPWKRRPEAASLLDDFRDSGRGFEAVVVGEPARAFSGNQFGLTFPVFVHYGVELWVPEVGGKVDPGSDAHDLVMSLYGGMSKGERNRIKVRVRSAMADQAAREGRFLGGRPPYGYSLADAGAHPNPSKAANGQRLRKFEVDPTAAPVVQRIFAEYLDGNGLYAIAEGLTRDRVPSPSAHDPARNRNRDGRAWAKSAVRSILHNPRYTGQNVWNRQRRDEILCDVEDVAAGYDTKLRWNDRADWIWSAERTHEAIVSVEDFARVQEQMGAGVNRPAKRKPRSAPRSYALCGMLTCGICGRRMSGQYNHGRPHYRCRYPSEYALANTIDHPRNVYVSEETITPKLDEWLLSLFDPENLDETCELLAKASGLGEVDYAQVEGARRKLTDCDARLAKYRSALENGADPTVVATWIAEVQGERLRAEQVLSEARQSTSSADEIRALLQQIGDLSAALTIADPKLKAEIYADLGIRLTYRPAEDLVSVEAAPTRGQPDVSEGGLELRRLSSGSVLVGPSIGAFMRTAGSQRADPCWRIRPVRKRP